MIKNNKRPQKMKWSFNKKTYTLTMAIFFICFWLFINKDFVSANPELPTNNTPSISQAVSEVMELEEKIATAREDLAMRSEQIITLDLIIKENEEEQKELRYKNQYLLNELEKSQKALSTSIILKYQITGNTPLGFPEVLLNSETVSEFLFKYEAWERITSEHNKIVKDIQKKKDDINKNQIQLTALSSSITSLKWQHEREITALNRDIADMEIRYADLLERLSRAQEAEMIDQGGFINLVKSGLDPESPDPGMSMRSQMIITALNQIGDPYVWGATGPDTFDCSGLTLYAHRSIGVTIPRVSRMQYRGGESIPIENIQPGDLVFLGDSPGTIHHVMIYVGFGLTLESPSTGDVVKIRPLTARNPSSFAGFARYLPPISPELLD